MSAKHMAAAHLLAALETELLAGREEAVSIAGDPDKTDQVEQLLATVERLNHELSLEVGTNMQQRSQCSELDSRIKELEREKADILQAQKNNEEEYKRQQETTEREMTELRSTALQAKIQTDKHRVEMEAQTQAKEKLEMKVSEMSHTNRQISEELNILRTSNESLNEKIMSKEEKLDAESKDLKKCKRKLLIARGVMNECTKKSRALELKLTDQNAAFEEKKLALARGGASVASFHGLR